MKSSFRYAIEKPSVQLELSHKSGISQASIARIEAGTQENLRTDTIQRLAVALQIPLPQFWDESAAVKEESFLYNSKTATCCAVGAVIRSETDSAPYMELGELRAFMLS